MFKDLSEKAKKHFNKIYERSKQIWNPNIEIRERITILFASFLITVLSYLYISHKMKLLDSGTEQMDFIVDVILPICTATMMFLFGLTLIIITLNITNKYVLILILLLHVVAFLTFEYVKYIIGLSFLLIIVAIIVMILKEVIITALSFSLMILFTCAILIGLEPLFQINTEASFYKYCYCIISICLIIYSLFAVRINRYLLVKTVNDHEYTQKDFTNSFNIIYAIIFITLNIFFDLLGGGRLSTLINNTILTCLAINQINFSLIGDKFITMLKNDFKKAFEKYNK